MRLLLLLLLSTNLYAYPYNPESMQAGHDRLSYQLDHPNDLPDLNEHG